MDQKAERLLKRVEKTAVRRSLREGHPLSREELLMMKVQILPNPLRVVMGLGACVAGIFSYLNWTWDSPESAWPLAILSVFLFAFAIFGIRRTLSKILDGMDVGTAAELLGAAVEGVVSAVGGIFDGL